jgi:outer membrane protein insertion porin family
MMKLGDKNTVPPLISFFPAGDIKASPDGTGLRFLALVLLICAYLISVPDEPMAAERDAAIFLPLKVNAAVDLDQLETAADQALEKALNSRPEGVVTAYSLLSRTEAKKYIDYQAAWPPSLEAVQNLAAKLGDFRYVAAGSLTRLGQMVSIDVKLYDVQSPVYTKYFYQENKRLETLPEAMAGIIDEIVAYIHRDSLIGAIVIKGNVRIDSGAVRRQIESRAGDLFDPKQLKIDLKNVYKMGYFDDVAVNVLNTRKGKEVIFEVKEKPVVGQVLLEGVKELKEEDVRGVITIAVNTILNPRKVQDSVNSIVALYKEKGFYNTKVEVKYSYPKPERVDVTFVIEEGSKVYTKEIRFVGNKAFSSRKLKKVIETSSRGLFSWITDSGLLKKEVLEMDVARLAAFYHNNGYIEAKIGEPEVVQEGKWLYVTFNIYEGDRYRVGKIDLTGDLIADKDELLKLLKIRQEKYLSRKILREDMLRLTDFYAENGYAFAEAIPSVSENKKDKTVDISIHISKGELVYINRIKISGNTRTRDKVIRRELTIKEQDVFNSKQLRISHENLQRLDYFEDVTITPEPTLDRNRMDVDVEVKEKPTGAFSIGAGYSSAEHFMFMGEISEDNFRGKGQRLALQVNLSGISSRYNISFTEPRYKDSKLLVGVDLYNWEREFDDYTKDSTGGAIRFGYPVWRKWYMGFGYGFDNADLTDIKETASFVIKQSADIHITSSVHLNFTRDTRNRRYNATKGSRTLITSKLAGGPVLRGDAAFTKLEASSSWYWPFFREMTLHLKGAAGQVFENSNGKLPVFEKFYLGGISDIRGFVTNHISPKAENGDRIGGTRMWYTNTELLFPLLKDAGLSGVIFFDAGNVYEGEWDFSMIKKSVGAGFRWLSPMGPLRLEYGRVINPAEDEDNGNWDFSIGSEF